MTGFDLKNHLLPEIFVVYKALTLEKDSSMVELLALHGKIWFGQSFWPAHKSYPVSEHVTPSSPWQSSREICLTRDGTP